MVLFRVLEQNNKYIPCSRNSTNSTSQVATMKNEPSKRISKLTIVKNSQVGTSQFLISRVEGNSSTNAATVYKVNHFALYTKHDYRHCQQ